jgi:hypothetical protein
MNHGACIYTYTDDIHIHRRVHITMLRTCVASLTRNHECLRIYSHGERHGRSEGVLERNFCLTRHFDGTLRPAMFISHPSVSWLFCNSLPVKSTKTKTPRPLKTSTELHTYIHTYIHTKLTLARARTHSRCIRTPRRLQKRRSNVRWPSR